MAPRPRAPLATTLLLAAALAACAVVVNPVTGERERAALTASAEARLGAEQAEAVERSLGRAAVSAPLTARVAAVGGRLAARSPRRAVTHRFVVVDVAEPLAFALPGGWIHVSRGLLPLLSSDAELAAVLAHEIAHVAALHGADRAVRPWAPGLGAVLGALDGPPPDAPWPARLLGGGVVAARSADQERLADRVAQTLAAQAGFDPAGLPRVLDAVERWSRARPRPAERLPDYLDAHPVTRERVEAARDRARTLTVAAAARTAAKDAPFLERLEGLLVGADPAEGAFRGDVFVHPRLDVAMAFPAGWARARQRAAAVARAPGGDALLVLDARGAPGDPVRGGRAWLAGRPLERLNEAEGTVQERRAYQARARGRTPAGEPVELLLTWIAHPRALLRVTGASPSARFHRFALALDAAATSLRRPAPRELAGLRERRLRVVQARAGESLADLSRRAGNAWSVEETAAANALPRRAPLGAGRSVKIAVERAWTAAAPAPR